MEINENAVQSLIRTAIGANNDVARELTHALEYYNASRSAHSIMRLLTAASALTSQNKIWSSANAEKARTAFCSIIKVAA